MDEKFQTSQQKAGEHQKAEGTEGAGAPDVQHGTEDAPTGVPTSQALKNPFDTTGNLKGAASLSES